MQRLLGGWAFALAFRREVFASLDVACTTATSLPPSRRCRLNGALLDELLLVTGLAPLLETNLRAEPGEKLHATDASPSGAGGCSASISREDWLAFYDLAEEKGEHVRLDWKGEEPPSNMHGVRAAAGPRALKLKWTTLFSYRFLAGKHTNLLELESLISLLRRITREAIRAHRPLVLVDSRVVVGAVSEGRSNSRKMNFLLRKLWFWCLACDIALELLWVPTWENPADAFHGANRSKVGVHHCQSFRPHQPRPWRQPMPSRCWICSVTVDCGPYSGRACAQA